MFDRSPLVQSMRLAGFLLCLVLPPALGHGRLREPPSRSSMWRDGFPNPPNYSDNELNCGGFANQWKRQDGNCGVCGDPWQGPRPNEAGGKYAKGIIARRYKEGATIEVRVEITAPHKGWYEFRLCENKDPSVPITHDCLNKHLLEIEGHGTRYFLKSTVPTWDNLRVKLPSGVTCKNCVLQWKWHCGNNWGTDPDGTGCIGCGAQEQFYGCSDIAIEARTQNATPSKPSGSTKRPTTTSSHSPKSTMRARPTTSKLTTLLRSTKSQVATTRRASSSATPEPVVTTKKAVSTTPEAEEPSVPCHARRWFRRQSGDGWCVTNCKRGFCPSSHCVCGDEEELSLCVPVGDFERVPGSEDWCESNCAMGNCPDTHCVCNNP